MRKDSEDPPITKEKPKPMMPNRIARLVLFASVLLPSLTFAQTPTVRPYHDGTVWDIAFIKVKPGVGLKYMYYLSDDWKKEHEALKKANLILSYKVIETEAHGTSDWDLMLMTEYKDLATMEANADKMEAVAMQALSSDDKKMIEGYKDRAEWREIVGGRLAREIVLEPKKQ
jgi:hypothetical protein